MKLGDTVTYRNSQKKFVGVIIKTYGLTVTVRNEEGTEITVGRRAMKLVPKKEEKDNEPT